MMDNVTYFWSSNAPFFWVYLNLYMVLAGDLPFRYQITQWMCWLLATKVLQYVLMYIMKSKGDCTELAIWRSVQMFFTSAPLHQLSIVNGTRTGFSIIFRDGDLSFWDKDNAAFVLFVVKWWLTLVIGVAIGAVSGMCLAAIVDDSQINSAMGSATLILVLIAIIVFDAFLDVWNLSAKVTNVSETKWAGTMPESGRWDRFRWYLRAGWSKFWRFFLVVRSRAWGIRWFLDLGLPLVILYVSNHQTFAMAAAFSMLVRI